MYVAYSASGWLWTQAGRYKQRLRSAERSFWHVSLRWFCFARRRFVDKANTPAKLLLSTLFPVSIRLTEI